MAASTTLTPQQRTLRARAAAYARWANENGQAQAQRAQRGLRDRFRRQVAQAHPDLPPAELERRAECAYRQHMTRLAYASSKARGGRRQPTTTGDEPRT